MRRIGIVILALAALALASCAARAAAVHEVPLILRHNNIFIDNVTLAGQGSYRAMIDTGSTHNLVDLDLAKAQGLKPTGTIGVAATGGGMEMPTFPADIIAVNGVPLMDADMPLIGGPLRRESAPIEQDMDLLLGYPLFRRWVVEMDFDKNVMRLHEPAQYTPPARAEAIPINLAINVPLIKSKVEDVSANLMIDTGANSMVDLYPEFLVRSGLHKKHTTYRMPVYGLGGTVDSILMRIDALELGAFTFNSMRVYAHAMGTFSSLIDGLIGTEIMRRFNVVFDYNHRIIYLTPNTHYADPWQEERAGLTALHLGDEYVVVSVAEGSPAQIAGLQMADIIVSVDGRPAADVGISGMRALVRQDPGVSIAFTVDRDSEQKVITIILEQYIK
jgi:predicted aspartyl protease